MTRRVAGKGVKGPKRKGKKESQPVPTTIDAVVTLPSGSKLDLRLLSTDTVADVRERLSDSVDFCHATCFSVHDHQLDALDDGPSVELDDSTKINSKYLQPCRLKVAYKPYKSCDDALSNVRRLIDIVGSVTNLGPASNDIDQDTAEPPGSAHGELCPPAQLSQFYSFFSCAQVPCPLNGVEDLQRGSREASELLRLTVIAASGARLRVAAGCEGFYLVDRHSSIQATLAELLDAEDSDFRDGYAALLAAFRARNPFGHVPVGLRANTWLAPPGCLGAAPAGRESDGTCPSSSDLPVEDQGLGGDGGGAGAGDLDRPRHWHGELSAYCALPGGTAAERQVRDRRVFLAHTHFVERATRRAVQTARGVDSPLGVAPPAAEEDAMVIAPAPVPLVVVPACGAWAGSSASDLAAATKAAVLRGVGACERTASEDVEAMTRVGVYLGGVRVEVRADPRAGTGIEPWAIEDEPAARDGGAGALNPSSLRVPLHAGHRVEGEGAGVDVGERLVAEILSRSATAVDAGSPPPPPPIRWELAATWLRHLAHDEDEVGSAAGSHSADPATVPANPELAARLGDEGVSRLATLPGSVYAMSPSEVVAAVGSFRESGAVQRLLQDFGSLELSPVDGRTLTDFIHVRGLNMRALGRVAEQSGTLSHVRELCVGEMAARALKRLLRAALAAAAPPGRAAVAAALLNAALGEGHPLSSAIWSWIRGFVRVRFGYDMPPVYGADAAETPLRSLRGVPLLRGICLKVGLEIRPADYDFDVSRPFRPQDILALVPLVKHAPYTSSDGRSLLEASKSALDKGRLEEAVSSGAAAVARIGAVCGPRSRASAGALSLMGVALYHAGNFAPAAACQQRALRVCERELGLDHPDTMKAYGDQAVFYYRLGHNALAIRYVNRALYLLQLTAGSEHPNTAATYINRGMMEEGVGRVGTALRFLQAALECNRRILGADHVQTAASFHAIAIALSLMDPPAYALSVQHEQTTLDILERRLGPEDPRSQDAAAWLEYFGSRAADQAEAARGGGPPPDASVASKGHLPLDDLMRFIGDCPRESGVEVEGPGLGGGGGGSGARERRRAAVRTGEKGGASATVADTAAADTTCGSEGGDIGEPVTDESAATGVGDGDGYSGGAHGVEGGEKSSGIVRVLEDLGDDGWEPAVKARPRSGCRGRGAAPMPQGKDRALSRRTSGPPSWSKGCAALAGRGGAPRRGGGAPATLTAGRSSAGTQPTPHVAGGGAVPGRSADEGAGVSYAARLLQGRGPRSSHPREVSADPAGAVPAPVSGGPSTGERRAAPAAAGDGAAAAVSKSKPPAAWGAQAVTATSVDSVGPTDPAPSPPPRGPGGGKLDASAPVFLPAARRHLNPTAKAFVPSSPHRASGSGDAGGNPKTPTMAEKLARSLRPAAASAVLCRASGGAGGPGEYAGAWRVV